MKLASMDFDAQFEHRRKRLYVVLAFGAVVTACALFATATNVGGLFEAWRTIRDTANPTPEQLRDATFGWSRWTTIGCLFALLGGATVFAALWRLNRLARDERALAAENDDVG